MKKHPFLYSYLGGALILLTALAVIAARPRPITTVPTSVTAWPTIKLNLVANGFSLPTFVTNANDGSGRLFVLEQVGVIRILHADGSINPTPFLDISSLVRSPASGGGSEQGLLGLAFPPDYTQKNHFYVYYTNLDGNNVVARFQLSSNPDVANPASEQQILLLQHPTYENHNGGMLAFGKDGYLYIGTGDGGSGGDPSGNAQNPASLLGKILRIDVEYSAPVAVAAYQVYCPTIIDGSGSGQAPMYRIPPSNPYFGKPGYRGEIWALGVRNPWRYSFDRLTQDLYIADVGQDLYEEVDFQPASSTGGQNYGWNIMEGFHCYNAAACNQTGLTLPVTEYPHNPECSITGGYVYRGSTYPTMKGIYFYADYCSGKVWGLQKSGSWQSLLLLQSGLNVSSFGESETGELYLVDLSGGSIYLVTVP